MPLKIGRPRGTPARKILSKTRGSEPASHASQKIFARAKALPAQLRRRKPQKPFLCPNARRASGARSSKIPFKGSAGAVHGGQTGQNAPAVQKLKGFRLKVRFAARTLPKDERRWRTRKDRSSRQVVLPVLNGQSQSLSDKFADAKFPGRRVLTVWQTGKIAALAFPRGQVACKRRPAPQDAPAQNSRVRLSILRNRCGRKRNAWRGSNGPARHMPARYCSISSIWKHSITSPSLMSL